MYYKPGTHDYILQPKPLQRSCVFRLLTSTQNQSDKALRTGALGTQIALAPQLRSSRPLKQLTVLSSAT